MIYLIAGFCCNFVNYKMIFNCYSIPSESKRRNTGPSSPGSPRVPAVSISASSSTEKLKYDRNYKQTYCDKTLALYCSVHDIFRFQKYVAQFDI